MSIVWFTLFFLVLLFISSILDSSQLAIKLNENQVLYLFSTTAQVVSAIYGLTLTGFIFFRNELSREEFEDETLAEAVDALKERYFVFLAFITFLVILTVLLSNLAIARESLGDADLNSFIMNTGQSAFITSLFAIAYFVFDVISPRRIEKASRGLQKELDPSISYLPKGSLEEFLKNYNKIEALLNEKYLPYMQITSIPMERYRERRVSNIRLAEILLRNEQIDSSLFKDLRELITLRNSIIHGAEPIVSQKAVLMSKEVLERLQGSIGGEENEL